VKLKQNLSAPNLIIDQNVNQITALAFLGYRSLSWLFISIYRSKKLIYFNIANSPGAIGNGKSREEILFLISDAWSRMNRKNSHTCDI
jgi:hypothetical protein